MLASNFMTADDLGIEEDQRNSLIKVLGMFERGEVRYERDRVPRPNEALDDDVFNMAYWDERRGYCGTVRCIGGWAEHVGKVHFGLKDNPNPELDKLFYPNATNPRDITLEQATTALRNYLTTGRARWAEVVQSTTAA